MRIRKATIDDFAAIYEFGKSTPELRVSATEEFMDTDELRWSLTQKDGVFLVAEERGIQGFIYANANDRERPMENKYACLVYIAVAPTARGRGVARSLYDHCTMELKARGITHIFTWANPDSGVVDFFKKQGLAEGHSCIWMDKRL